jgi:hypothetical protein
VCADRRIRVFKFQTGKLRRVYDESLEAANEAQRSEQEIFQVIDIERDGPGWAAQILKYENMFSS